MTDRPGASPDRLYEGYVFDLDGTVYLGDDLLPGAGRLIRKLREVDRRVIFLSNNPTRDPQMYAEKPSLIPGRLWEEIGWTESNG